MPRGGKRANAGRPPGVGPYREKTKPLRIPISMIQAVTRYIQTRGCALPLFTSKVQAGFPSPADDYQEGTLDLNEYLIRNPAATFYVRASGNSMINAGIHPGDLLIVDRSITATSGKIVIAVVNGEFTVKRLMKKGQHLFLMAENPDYPPIAIKDKSELEIWGVVTNVVHGL